MATLGSIPQRAQSVGLYASAIHRQFWIIFLPSISLLVVLLAFGLLCPAYAQNKHKEKLPKPRRLDQELSWQRDTATGELRVKTGGGVAAEESAAGSVAPISVVTQMVPVTCSVATADGTAVPGLQQGDFQVFDNGVAQKIAYFDASTAAANVALVIDASPSVLRDSEEMKRAALALLDALAPLDQTAVVDFSAHSYLQLPFTDVRELARRAIQRIDARQLLEDTGGSNIYQAVYLTASELFRGRSGRKAIVLVTDGEDSGLGLTLDAASRQAEGAGDRLTYEDLVRTLSANDIEVFVLSTEFRPAILTPQWFEAHRNTTLATAEIHKDGMPLDTLFLAELVRRVGGQLYFLAEANSMTEAFRTIASKIRAEYTLGYYPAQAGESFKAAGWHELRVEIANQPNAVVTHRAAYYVSSTP
jgi:Ca-activated chloride channel family protein